MIPAGEPIEGLFGKAQFFSPGKVSHDHREVHRPAAEDFYRQHWRYAKVVYSTHDVNCSGSCSWKIYVKDGTIAWGTHQTDYPSVRGHRGPSIGNRY